MDKAALKNVYYIFIKLNPRALFILQQAVYNSHSRKNLPYLLNLCVKHSV
jgi:hypothetical protein